MLSPARCLLACNGQEALSQLEQDADFDVVVCDVVMPKITGIDLFKQVGNTYPELQERWIFMSGGAIEDAQREWLERSDCPFLLKPVAKKQLLQVVHQIVTKKGSHGEKDSVKAAVPLADAAKV